MSSKQRVDIAGEYANEIYNGDFRRSRRCVFFLDFGTVPIVGYIFILFLILFYTNW
jgi:hypothetical protein